MLYEIVNMSDPYTIEAKSLEIAFVASLFLGRGQYAFEPVEVGNRNIPLFLFGGADQWSRDHLGADLQTIVERTLADESKRLELAECLDSCLIGQQSDRAIYLAARELIDDPAKRAAWREQWHESRRSSINDIGARAYQIATNLRAGMRNPLVPTPQQVFVKP